MTKRMVNAAVLVAVLTVAVLAPSTTFAATQTVRTTQISAHTGIALLDMILSAFGFNTVSGSRTAPAQLSTGGAKTTPAPTTDGAIWGGAGGKCPYGC